MSRASDVYGKHWSKMVKLITTVSNSIKAHIDTPGNEPMDHETLLMAMQVFVLICGEKWGFSRSELDRMLVTCKEIHKLVRASMDSKNERDVQVSSFTGKVFKN